MISPCLCGAKMVLNDAFTGTGAYAGHSIQCYQCPTLVCEEYYVVGTSDLIQGMYKMADLSILTYQNPNYTSVAPYATSSNPSPSLFEYKKFLDRRRYSKTEFVNLIKTMMAFQ